jgi:hypothetical protein
MATKYRCEFFSENVDSAGNEQKWKIDIDSASFGGAATDFKCTSEGFVLNMDGTDDSLVSPIKTTSVTFNMILDSVGLEAIIADIQSVSTGSEDDFSIAIYNYYNGAYRLYWTGYLLSDLAALDDVSINRIITIKATDGLTRLKYKYWDNATYSGAKSPLNIIKTCLSPLTLINSYFSDTDNYIGHTPFYYNEAMLGGSTWNNTWKNNVNHDPLSLSRINVLMFKDDSGQPWSYYKILEQMLALFQLRIMMTSLTDASHDANGKAIWYIQSPYVWHGNNNNDNYISTTYIFYHSKLLASDVALSVSSSFTQAISNPAERLAGGKEMFTSPLLNYKCIYNHSIFNGVVGSIADTANVTINSKAQTGVDVLPNFSVFEAMSYNLSGITDTPPIGAVGNANKVSQQRILITGNVTTDVVDNYYYSSQGESMWLSGKEYFESNYQLFFSPYYFAQDEGWHFPRLGLKVRTTSEDTETSGTISQDFWFGHSKFGFLFGSVQYLAPFETDAYSSNWSGIAWGSASNYSDAGLTYNGDDTSGANTLTFDDGTVGWGLPIGNEDGYWNALAYDGDISNANNDFTYFSPIYNNHNAQILNVGNTWTDELSQPWKSACQNNYLRNSTPFAIMTPPIPWNRGGSGATTYGWSRIDSVEFTYAFTRDVVTADDGYHRYACAKDWTMNRELLPENRGVHFGYSLSNVRIYVLGVNAGADSYDATIAWWQNTNGSPSDEEVQEPEIIIGDEPQINPNADIANLEGFGGSYSGQFTIVSTAGSTVPVTGTTTQDWRTIRQPDGSEDMKLHIKRAKQALAHRYAVKKKLNISFRDRNSNFDMSRGGFANIIRFTTGEWSTNEGADIAFMPTGGSFIAGTGEWTYTLEDCITYSKNNLTDKSYSTDG